MRRFLVAVSLCACLCATPSPVAAAPDPAPPQPVERLDEGMKRLQEGIPVLLHVLQVLQREGPALLEVSQKAAAEAQKAGGETLSHKDGSMPSAEEMAQKMKGLQSLAEVMRQATPILMRLQRELEPSRLTPRTHKSSTGGATATPVTEETSRPAPSLPERPDPDLAW